MTKLQEFTLPEIPAAQGMTTQEYAYRRLHNAIMVGAIRPGTALTIRGLASHLELSPTPIREAIRRLSTERAVELQGNRRLIVPRMTAGRFEELIHLRIALETHGGERSFPYISDIDIENVDRIDNQMDSAIRNGDFDGLTHLNHEFHRRLYQANPNQSVMPLIESVWLQLGPFQRQVLNRVQDYYVIDRHKEIIGALRDRDPIALTVAIAADIRDGIGRTGRVALQREHTEKLLT